MNSIKQVPTRVRSRRVEANLGAEREHFEKKQVNAEEGSLGGSFYACGHWVATSCVCGGDGTGRRTHLSP